jgi:hypothetical protein
MNAALDDAEQAILRKQAKAAVRNGGPAHFFSESDTFDRIPGGMLARRNNKVRAIAAPEEGVYG